MIAKEKKKMYDKVCGEGSLLIIFPNWKIL